MPVGANLHCSFMQEDSVHCGTCHSLGKVGGGVIYYPEQYEKRKLVESRKQGRTP